jgi:hypothetical protein
VKRASQPRLLLLPTRDSVRSHFAGQFPTPHKNRNMPTTKSIESKQFAHRSYTVPPRMCKRFASAKLGRELQLAEIEEHFRLVSDFTDRPGPGRFEAISFVDR